MRRGRREEVNIGKETKEAKRRSRITRLGKSEKDMITAERERVPNTKHSKGSTFIPKERRGTKKGEEV